jgi:hypothetical protein
MQQYMNTNTLSREELWAQYVAKNPQFAGEGNVTMSARGLQKLFAQTWTLGHERGFANGRAYEKTEREKSPADDLYSRIFGKAGK